MHPTFEAQLEDGICSFFQAHECNSCSLMGVPHATQLELAKGELIELLAAAKQVDYRLLDPIISSTWGFRAKAKMVVASSANEPILTLPKQALLKQSLSKQTAKEAALFQTDLSTCPLYKPLLAEVLESAKAVLKRAQVPPYQVETKRGEAKFLLVSVGENEALVRFVLKSKSALERIKEHLHLLHPKVSSVWANIQPLHAAILEGEEDIHLAGAENMVLWVNDLNLRVLPKSFTQTNTKVAEELYLQAAAWLAQVLKPGAKVWDLYTGIGGFAFTIAAKLSSECEVVGVEISQQAAQSAQLSAAELGLENVSFIVADAASWAMNNAADPPAALVMNPPRRGIGSDFSTWINTSNIDYLVYSSCNPKTFAADLMKMPNYRVVEVRLADMFVHSTHTELIALLVKTDS